MENNDQNVDSVVTHFQKAQNESVVKNSEEAQDESVVKNSEEVQYESVVTDSEKTQNEFSVKDLEKSQNETVVEDLEKAQNEFLVKDLDKAQNESIVKDLDKAQNESIVKDLGKAQDESVDTDSEKTHNESLIEDLKKVQDDSVKVSEEIQSSEEITLSKRQLKKIKKREKWLKLKPEKRMRERAKAKQKRAYAKANNLDLGPSRKFLKSCTMADSSCELNVTIDLSFDEFMTSKDVAKLIKQILRCYTLNRRAIQPVQFSLTNFNGISLEEMGKHNGYEHWDVKFYSESYLKVFPKDKIVYLTSESENVIEELKDDHVYVIGGLVDHNGQKGLCHRLAIENGVEHGRLPLDKFLQMKARKVLTVDHVFEIILRVTEGKTWQEAFLQVLPERKNAQPISKETINSDQLNTSEETELIDNEIS